VCIDQLADAKRRLQGQSPPRVVSGLPPMPPPPLPLPQGWAMQVTRYSSWPNLHCCHCCLYATS